jgi:hypothetical protein
VLILLWVYIVLTPEWFQHNCWFYPHPLQFFIFIRNKAIMSQSKIVRICVCIKIRILQKWTLKQSGACAKLCLNPRSFIFVIDLFCFKFGTVYSKIKRYKSRAINIINHVEAARVLVANAYHLLKRDSTEVFGHDGTGNNLSRLMFHSMKV